MTISPLAGHLPPVTLLVDVPRLITAYYTETPDPAVVAQRVFFGTSGHRGSSFNCSFNENHILAITQAICHYRTLRQISGPLFIGIDTHALSAPARATALEVLAANQVVVMIDDRDDTTPTPVISHAILTYNRGRKDGLADGIIITPSHNPPDQGGFKYNPPTGGPADSDVTRWIEDEANQLLAAGLVGIKRIPLQRALQAPTTRRHDYLNAYINDLGNVVNLEVICGSSLRLGVDPLGGAGVHYWAQIAERHELELTVVNDVVDPTFRFMTVDWDGQIRMDPSSPYAMARLIGMKDRFDLLFACDTDHDRHGIVTPSDGLLPPNHFLAVCIDQLFPHRPQWSSAAAVGKTMVSSSMIDRVTAKQGRRLHEVPVGFKWFVAGLLDGSLGFVGEESAGASFLRMDGNVWTTDKDGFIPCLLAAEMTARTGHNPGELYRQLTHAFGESFYTREDAPATPAEKKALAQIQPKQVSASELAGEKIQSVLNQSPDGHVPLGGLKVTTANGWFAARPSGTEAITKIYAESFRDEAHLRQILQAARVIVSTALAEPASPQVGKDMPPHLLSAAEAVEVWQNEGGPN